jgi:hypothetical protein
MTDQKVIELKGEEGLDSAKNEDITIDDKINNDSTLTVETLVKLSNSINDRKESVDDHHSNLSSPSPSSSPTPSPSSSTSSGLSSSSIPPYPKQSVIKMEEIKSKITLTSLVSKNNLSIMNKPNKIINIPPSMTLFNVKNISKKLKQIQTKEETPSTLQTNNNINKLNGKEINSIPTVPRASNLKISSLLSMSNSNSNNLFIIKCS